VVDQTREGVKQAGVVFVVLKRVAGIEPTAWWLLPLLRC
jgi:hypothetical protein